jgi:hypothetical protein
VCRSGCEGGGQGLREAAPHFVLFGLFVYLSLKTRFRDNDQLAMS